MRFLKIIILAATVSAPLLAAPRPASRKPSTAAKPAPEAKLMQSCDAHKFETIVDTVVDGQPRKSKLKMCGVEGQSDSAWIETLRDAIRKVEANQGMPAAQRSQIVSAIKAEIARLSIIGSPAAVPAPVRSATAGESPPPSSLSRDYAALPPLPPELPPAPASAPPSATTVTTAAGGASAGQQMALPTVPVRPTPTVPKLTLGCYVPGDLTNDAPCGQFERETLLTVRSVGRVPPGTALRFVRNGEDRAEVELTPLSVSKSMQVALPREVCSGFGAGRLELQVVVDGSVARTEGRYPLRCY